MTEFFTILTDAVGGNLATGLLAAFAWGILSILLSPCHLASLPLIIGFVSGQKRSHAGYAFTISLLFALGILVSIAIVGAVTATAGRIMGDLGQWGNRVVAVILLVVGLQLLDVIPAPWQAPDRSQSRASGPWGAFALGLVFGLALGPCTFAFLAPVLGVAFKTAGQSPIRAFMLISAFALGHCGVITAAGAGTGWIQRYLDWDSGARGVQILRKSCGILVILGGLWLI
jgi:cytochrome c-type biogenesis protein